MLTSYLNCICTWSLNRLPLPMPRFTGSARLLMPEIFLVVKEKYRESLYLKIAIFWAAVASESAVAAASLNDLKIQLRIQMYLIRLGAFDTLWLFSSGCGYLNVNVFVLWGAKLLYNLKCPSLCPLAMVWRYITMLFNFVYWVLFIGPLVGR